MADETADQMAEENGEQVWHLCGIPTYHETVEFIRDGAAYMDRWLKEAKDIDSKDSGVLHSAWRLQNVSLANFKGSENTHLISVMRNQESSFYIRLSGHGFALLNLRKCLRLKATKWTSGFNSNIEAYIDVHFADTFGSVHQKSTCFISEESVTVMLGSIDLTKRRRDDSKHTRSTSAAKKPSHDLGVVLKGEAAKAIATNELDSWILASYYRNREPWLLRTPRRNTPETLRRHLLDKGAETPAAVNTGDAQVQILRARGLPTKRRSWQYGFETHTEFKEAYLNALETAQQYVYIEDQYFIPNFGDAAYGSWPWASQRSPMSELKAAIEREVRLIVVLPSTDARGPGIGEMRDNAIDGLRRFALRRGVAAPIFLERWSVDSEKPGDPVPVPLHVHSKLLICDDLYAIVGSGNVNTRSFANDLEMGVGISGSDVKRLRMELWSEHSGDSCAEDWRCAFKQLMESMGAGDSLLSRYETQERPYPPGLSRRLRWKVSETSRQR